MSLKINFSLLPKCSHNIISHLTCLPPSYLPAFILPACSYLAGMIGYPLKLGATVNSFLLKLSGV